MGVFQALTRRRMQRQVTRLAGDVARRGRSAVWGRVHHRIGPMSLAEARGYIRARAAAVIHAELSETVERQGDLPAWARERMLAESTELVIQFVLAELLKLGQQHFLRQRRVAA